MPVGLDDMNMNSNLKNAIYAISSIAIIFPSILFVSDYVYFQEPLSRVALYPDDPTCNVQCVEEMHDSYKCVEIKQDEFVCRKARNDTIGDDTVRYNSAGPISYGEIVYFPEGKSDVKWFNLESVDVIDKNSKTILVEFNDADDDNDSGDVIYTAKLSPKDTFLSCNPWDSTHLVQYTGLYEYENKTYAEFWGLHPYTPSELFPCDVSRILDSSLKMKYDISLPEYDEFGFD